MSLKFGIILSVYNSIDYLRECLRPWIEYENPYDLIISVVDCKFKGFDDGLSSVNSTDGTIELLQQYLNRGEINHLAILPPSEEHVARTLATEPLKLAKVDYIWNLDSDEIYTPEQINNIINFVSRNEFTWCFRINFKNYVFDKNHYIEGFCPRRIWKTGNKNQRLESFYYDNDCLYRDNVLGNTFKDSDVSTIGIPKNIAFIDHWTWLSDERSKQKVLYQKKRWGPNGCSYSWDDKNNCIIFNEKYYKLTNTMKPELISVH